MSNDQSRARIRDAGFDIHLVKPVDPHNLLAVVDRLWRAWQEAVESAEAVGPGVGGGPHEK